MAFTSSVNTSGCRPDFHLYLESAGELPHFFALDIEDAAVSDHLAYCLELTDDRQRRRGMPEEDLRDVVNTMFYASEMVGGLVPMLFTPVPGSIMFEQYEGYLFEEMGFDLQHLNGKLYPFLKYNFERKGVRLADYVALESLAFRLNAKTMGHTFQLDARNTVYRALRRVLATHDGVVCPSPVLDGSAAEADVDSRVAMG